MAQGDLFQIIDHQRYLGEDLLNVYYYRQTTIGTIDSSNIDQLLTEFLDTVVTPLLQLQSDDLAHTSVEIRNLSNNLDFAVETLTNVNGAIVAADTANLPSYVSIGFQLVRETLTTRNGYKRFAGITEGQVSGNSYVTPGGAPITNMQTALASDLTIDVARVVEPVILRKPTSSPPWTSYTYASIGSARFIGLGTQNTRKASS